MSSTLAAAEAAPEDRVTPVSRVDLESASPGEIYATVAEMGEDEFDELMQRPDDRERVINALVDRMVHLFRPEKSEGVEAAIHIKLWDRPGGGYDHLELQISDRSCRLIERPRTEDPELTLKVRPTDLRKLMTGETGARRLAFRGRLRVLGDLGLGMRLPDLFEF
jgi:putative sterol carrier protein